MKDPVLLPTSGNICDFTTMQRHLLNDEHDPFNRAPLKISDLVEQKELKARIQKWIQQKLAGEETDEDKRIKAEKGGHQEDQKMTDENDYSSELFTDEQNQFLRA